MTTPTKIRIITLTNRPPVRIMDADWPLIAKGWDGDNRAIPQQSNREWTIRVRQHADGRSIVYGIYDTAWQGEANMAAGELLAAGDDLVSAIRRVGADIEASDRAIRACIADLPAETI